MRSRQLRSWILGVLSLALVATLFLIYQYSETKTTPILLTGPPATPAPTTAPITMSPKQEGKLSIGNENVSVGGGGEMRCELYDDAGRSRGRLVAAEWRPLGARGLMIEVIEPRIRVHTPSGAIIDLQAGRGVIERKSTDITRFEMRSAKLDGDVRIDVDRLSDAQRDALADGATAPPDDDDRYIRLAMDDLFFDLEFARVVTEGPFHVYAAEAEIHGSGLNLRYNELDSRVEELTIREGERIVVWNMGDRFQIRGISATDEQAGATDAGAAKSQPKETAPTPTPVAQAAGNDDLPPLLAEDEPRKPRQRPTDVYTATFAGNVNVQEYKQDDPAGSLLADHLSILFDFSQHERELARRAPASSTTSEDTNTNGETASATAGAQTTDPVDRRKDRIELSWSGQMRLTSERLAGSADDAQRQQRVHLTATGERVVVRDALHEIECGKLVYRNESQAVELTRSNTTVAHVRLADGGEIFGSRIVLDRDAGQARAEGPNGKLIAALDRRSRAITGMSAGDGKGEGTPVEVRFEGDVVAEFGKASAPRFNPRTGETVMVEREVLRSAVFTGAVKMLRGDERFEGERIEIDFGLDPNGKQYPTAVRAFERVVAAQGARYISARDKLLVDFTLLEKPTATAPFDLARAQQAARDRGEDPGTLNWDAIRTHYEQQRTYQPGLKRLRAFGDAEVRDPLQRLDIDCDVLDCRFRGGREIESGLVTPRGDGRAFVALGSFSISAGTPIPFDAFAQTAHVDGPGRMTFPSKQDIDGRVLDEPMIVGIKWTERMSFDGGKNEAMFRGGVHAETERSDFSCANLRIDFVDAAPIDDRPIAAGTGANASDKWWVLQPLMERDGDAPDRITLTGPSLDKEPIYLYATDNVVAQTTNYDESSQRLKSRVNFKGPILAVDLQKRQMLMDGAGTLLIEDYRAPTTSSDGGGSSSGEVSPFGRSMGGEPSQTFISWDESMSFHDVQTAAEFRKNVTLMHSTGSKMMHAAQFIGDAAAASGRGRESKLNCQTLVVSFARDPQHPDINAGTSQMSGMDVDAFTAARQVYFFDSGISVIADQITYSRSDGALQILGTDGAPAELFDQRQRFNSLKGPRFIWNRQTNQILAPHSRGRMN